MDRIKLTREIIFQRRSVRKYTKESIPEDILQFLCEAGMAAPSANNYQPWHIILITERQILDALAESHPYGKMLFQAKAAIAVAGDTEKSPRYWVQDCSAATENILIAAAGCGLGAVWLGIYPREERMQPVEQILQVPAPFRVLSLISMGYPDERKEQRTQFTPEKLSRNTWGK